MSETVENKVSKTSFFSERKQRLGMSLLVAVALSFVLFVVAPLDIFGNNLEELNFSFSDFSLILALFALSNTVLVFCILFFIPRKGYRVMLAIFIATGLLLVIQQNFLNFRMTSLPGDNLTSELPVWQILLDTALWLGGYAVAVYLVLKKDEKGRIKSTATLLAVILFATQVVSALSIIVSNTDMFTAKLDRSEGGAQVLTVKNYTDIASDNNIFYFVVDRFDEDYAEDAYNEDNALFDDLNGFTWYQDHTANYGHTFPGVANMLTNSPYTAAESRAEYLDKAYEGEIPLKKLADNGYTVNLYTQAYYAFTDAQKLPTYIANRGEVSSVQSAASTILSLKMAYYSLYRGLPLLFKKFLTVGSTAELNSLTIFKGTIDGVEYDGYDSDTREAYRSTQKTEFKSGAEKQFSFIHFEGCHDSKYNEQWEKGGGSTTISVRNSFQIVKTYINAMKEMGVYDNATIIITGDHSYAHNDFKDIKEPRLTALFIKRSGETGAFKTSMAQTSHKDIWATILHSEGIDYSGLGENYNTSIFTIGENETRTRTMIWHTFSLDCDEYFYTITGKGRDYPSSWHQTRHEHYNKFVMN